MASYIGRRKFLAALGGAAALPRRQFLYLAAGAATLLALSQIASAQIYPSRPITMIVPFAAGGPTDVVGRIMAERLRASLGQTVVIENVTGAGGSIAVVGSPARRPMATPSASGNGPLTSSTALRVCRH
jgi:tripartite-type tricarboxylate transporter receptor subunit TctC